MNLIAFAILIARVTVYFAILLLALRGVFDGIHHHLDNIVLLIREQRDEDLRWHRESLLAHIRLDRAQQR